MTIYKGKLENIPEDLKVHVTDKLKADYEEQSKFSKDAYVHIWKDKKGKVGSMAYAFNI